MAKVASKTNPARSKGAAHKKTYNGKPVIPAMYIARHGKISTKYRSAQYVGAGIVEDKNGNPIHWDEL